MARDLSDFVSGFNGVESVEVGVGRGYTQGDIYNRVKGQGSLGKSSTAGTNGGESAARSFKSPDGNADDLELAAKVQATLTRDGHNVSVCARKGALSLTINDHENMLKNMGRDLCDFVSQFDGVKSVRVGVGRGYHQADIYRRIRQEKALRLLLVDDEREFVQTLSERLQMRDIGSVAVCDGETALNMMRENEPEVIILDLNMPGLNGIEVLRRVKRDHPKVEVLILTGQGSDKDRETCLDLGVFAYLKKPVNIDTLSNSIRNASEKIRCTTS